MIEIKQAKEQEYLVIQNQDEIGIINTYRNSFHNKNCYLKLEMQRYDAQIAEEIFSRLMKEIKCSMQVMISSEQIEKIAFLESGGFSCKRKCYEIEVERKDYIGQISRKVDVFSCKRGSSEYEKASELLYDYYRKNHERVSPLTVDITAFLKNLPELVYYEECNNLIINAVFVEENGILFFECDDCDEIAMQLLSLFDIKLEESYNTYTREVEE